MASISRAAAKRAAKAKARRGASPWVQSCTKGVPPAASPSLAPRAPSSRAVEPDKIAIAAERRLSDTAVGTKALADRVAGLRSLDQLLPRRASDGGAHSKLARRDSVPTAPSVLYNAMSAAIKDANLEWATTSPEVAALLADDVEYIDLRGEAVVGKQAALESMNAGASDRLSPAARDAAAPCAHVRHAQVWSACCAASAAPRAVARRRCGCVTA